MPIYLFESTDPFCNVIKGTYAIWYFYFDFEHPD